MSKSMNQRRPQAAATRKKTDATIAASFLSGNAGRPDGLNATTRIASGGGVAAEELVRRSNFWRDNYNPLRSLTVAQLMALFEQAERGSFAEIQLLLRLRQWKQ